ncbi:transcription factor GTE4-like isoform X2 [Andrographis paniculata]|uniref:transcription factor GTE4-like isoform X2 n=1 Tax=Andrographis paniculata TaxID=175694 RepID=UPI0021E92402|nr:transcription factor GTE4-like isoform X2 [Andrographis paniculata]
MDSGSLGDSDEDLKYLRRRSTEKNRIVYTRRSKKALKSSNNNDTAPATCSTGNLTSSAPSTSAANPTSSVTDVSPAEVNNAVAAGLSPARINEGPKYCDTASPLLPVINGNLAGTGTASPSRLVGDNVEESLGATVGREGDPQKSPSLAEVLQRGSPGKDADSSGQLMLDEQQQPREEMPSLLEDESSAQVRVHEDCGSLTDGKQNVSEGKNLEKSTPVHSEIQQMSDDRLPSLKEQPTFPSENDQSIDKGLAASDLLAGNESLNDKEPVTGSIAVVLPSSVSTVSPQVPEGNAPAIATVAAKPLVVSSVDDRIRINLCNGTPKADIKELKKKLELELNQVRRLVKQFESKELHLASYNTQISKSNISMNSSYVEPEDAPIGGYSQPQPQHSQNEVVNRRVLVRMNSEMGVKKHKESRPASLVRVNSDMGAARNLESRPYRRQLTVALMETSDPGVEKEKRTPKANQYYRNSEFLLGKDRLPPENTKRHKSNNGRKHSREAGFAFGFGFDKNRNRLFRSCGSLLQRLMKHKFGWVFNEPVDAKALGLIDYHDIIKHPMDLGTIKTRLAQNWYKSPGEFAEDVRLVFRNAMTYNPKGQDVHVMAEQLLQTFEERWAIIEAEYNPYWKYQMYPDGGLYTSPSRKAPPQSHRFSAVDSASAPIPAFIPSAVHGPAYVPAAAASQMRNSNEPEPMSSTMVIDPKIQRPYFGRTPAPRKPKAKDPNKRDMTYDEKQRLSTNLQGLPPEKLDAVIQIIKKRNTAVSQNDDEIEVDIDSVDTETLWELDRFVTNYKKSLSKNKRRAELALQARMAANQSTGGMNSTLPSTEKYAATGAGEKERDSRSRSSSSNSSSSDSGSSSSDSDSESSSADGSDAEHTPRT